MSKFKEGDLVEITEWNYHCFKSWDIGVIQFREGDNSWDVLVKSSNQTIREESLKLAYKFNVGDKVVDEYGREEVVHSILSEDRFVAVNSYWNFSCESFSEFKLIKEELKVGDIVKNSYWEECTILQFLGKDTTINNNLLVKDYDWDFIVIDWDRLIK